ncbi:alpha/beta hydrolase [Paraburkholderia sp. J94]|uniref:alpha/beta hydrolase n=1 Tax=Paraburkholderia sp. J94 TaxID=2805441 RepID=UPI002AB18934|nr:alpha/beta fold hydrolase [Paraburkholderia sp. J94]
MFKRLVIAASLSASALLTGPATAQSAPFDSAQDGGAPLHRDLVLPYLLQLPDDSLKAAEHAPLIILLHGRGSNEADLFSLRDALPKQYAIVSARAPGVLGDDSYEWFESVAPNGRLDGDPISLRQSTASIEQLRQQLIDKYHFDRRRVYLVGFSQGAIMSYEVALTDPKAFRGIGVMSGAFFDSLAPHVSASPSLKPLRIFISHGDADTVIPVAYEHEAVSRLQALGLRPEAHVYRGMSHEIRPDAMRDLVAWLNAQ